MRIAIVNSTSALVGGAERYIDESIPYLLSRGNDVALCLLQESPASGRAVSHEAIGVIGARVRDLIWLNGIGALAEWRPDVTFVHCLLPRLIEERLLSVAPSVLFAHDYIRTCISGSKTLHNPDAHPCSRRLAPGCLAHYYPHRCGGLNPVTMARNYRRGRGALSRLPGYAAVVTFSEHMRSEYVTNSQGRANVVLIPPFTAASPADSSFALSADESLPRHPHAGPYNANPSRDAHLGFLGRLEKEKGAGLLIAALPLAAEGLGKRIKLTIAGRGRQNDSLESQACDMMNRHQHIAIEFTNWLTDERIGDFFDSLDLIVIPSTWPEPFALVGLEAGAKGVPAVAFAVGGVPDWLSDGYNGHLASGDPPSTAGLAAAIVAALSDAAHHQRLRQAAATVSSRYSIERHHALLLALAGRIIAPNDVSGIGTR